MRRKYDFFAERANFGRIININLAKHIHNGATSGELGAPLTRMVATSMNFTPVSVDPNASDPAEPLLQLFIDDAQALMDELWQAGVRPANGVGSVGQLAATETHLKDMQKIAFDLLGRAQP